MRAPPKDHTLFSDGAHRKAFRESVRPGWEYLGRKMVSFPCLSGPWPPDAPCPETSTLFIFAVLMLHSKEGSALSTFWLI